MDVYRARRSRSAREGRTVGCIPNLQWASDGVILGRMTTAPANWYADPAGNPNWRYWDGTRWTEHVAGYATPVPAPVPASPVRAPAP